MVGGTQLFEGAHLRISFESAQNTKLSEGTDLNIILKCAPFKQWNWLNYAIEEFLTQLFEGHLKLYSNVPPQNTNIIRLH